MGLEFLPRVENCCGFIDLRIGSILIAVYALFAAVYQGANVTEGIMGCYIKAGGGILGDIARSVSKFFYPVSGVLIITAIVFLVGLAMERPFLVYLFAIALLMMFIVESILSLLILVNTIVNINICGLKSLIYDIVGLIIPLLYLYFAIVVNSFSEII